MQSRSGILKTRKWRILDSSDASRSAKENSSLGVRFAGSIAGTNYLINFIYILYCKL